MSNRLDKRGWESATISDVHLLIEPTDFCNCNCIMCKQSVSKTIHGDNPRQYMDFGLFVKIVKDIKEAGFVTSIDPLWAGESTIHPDFKEMMYYLFTFNIKHNLFRGFVLNTNAINMDEELSGIFLHYAKYIQSHRKENFMRLYFSLEAARPATYEKIKNVPGENLIKAIKNISYLVRKRKELGLIIPNLTFGFIVMEENQGDACDFRDLWAGILKDSGVPYDIVATWPLLTDRDSVYYRQLICPEPKKAEELHKAAALKLGLIEEKHSEENKNIKGSGEFRQPCGALWRTPNIASNGDVVPCCRDINLTLKLGNIKGQSLYDIWHGERITELRLSHIKGDFNASFQTWPTCKVCLEPEAGILSDKEIFKYLESIGKVSLMKKYLNRKAKYGKRY